MSFSVAVTGASGYAGGEILRLLADHPDFTVTTVTGRGSVGTRLVDAQPHLRSYADLVIEESSVERLREHDIVFVALPHGASGELTDALGDSTVIVDCGADHRLERKRDWDAFYSGDFREPWVYGVPELPRVDGSSRDRIRGARRIAAPGCNASTVALSLAPGIAAGVIESADIVSVLAVGPSGAGKSAKVHLLASELLGSAHAYGVGGSHRHIPEVLQSLRAAGAGDDASISFTPVLVPMARGILATSTAKLRPGVSAETVRRAWIDAYGHETFVQVLDEGLFPRTADVLGANTALMGLAIDEAAGRVTVVAAVDNLVKGTAGAAIQSANLAFGLPESTGLSVNGVAP